MTAGRTERMIQEVRDKGADAFVLFNNEISGQPGTRYISGFSGTESVILVSEKGSFIFVDGRYFSRAAEECHGFELVKLGSSNFWDEFGKIGAKLGFKKFLIDPSATRYSSVVKLEEKYPGAAVVTSDDILRKIRAVKDEDEIGKIKKAAEISAAAFSELLNFMKEGITEKELAVMLERLMVEKGAERAAFDTIVASGTNGAKPHAAASGKKIAKGELITVDFGCFFDGYASDITRTVALGAVPEKLLDIYGTVKKAQELGLRAAKAGMPGSELDKICRDHISGRGYGEYFLHSTGHGLGMEVHESPSVGAGSKDILADNSVITVEPGIYIDGIGGVRIEDDIVIKKNGSVDLSGGITKELVVLH